jgi:putative ABC transport system permease protein
VGSRWSRLASLWRNLFRRARVERELDDELRGYVDMLADEKEGRGMSRAEAGRTARLEAGGVEQVKELVRDARAGAFLETLARDVRYGARTLRRSPAFTVAIVLVLAVGIGATTAVFSVVDAVLLRPLAYREPGRLVVMLHRGVNPVSPANFLDWRRESSAFERTGAAESWAPNLSGGDEAETVPALRMTADVFPMLGVPPMLGRAFLPAEEAPGGDHVVVLGYGLWQRRFGGDAGIVGREITLNGEPYTVVGVMPRTFAFPPFWATGAEVWAPLALADKAANRGGSSLRVFARLKPGVSLAQARAEMAAITGRLEKQFPGTNRHLVVRTLTDAVAGNVRPALLVLLGAVGFLLLITCSNVAHMLLARAAAREREVALRATLGATRGRLVRQFLTESLLLALAGGAVGMLIALGGMRILVAVSPPNLPRMDTVALDGAALAFVALVSMATGVAFGLAPALQAARQDVGESLKEGARGATEGGHRSRLRRLLVASEFALALVLSAAAGLMIRSFVALARIDPGFDPRGVLTMVVSVTGSREAEPQRRASFYEDLLRQVRAVPGVRAASAINHLPLAGDIWGWPFQVEGRPLPAPGDSPTATYRVVLPGYFEAMGIPILRGRDVAETDRLGVPGVVVVNEWLARRHWPGEDPIGKRIALDDPRRESSWLTVVGVVKNAVRGDWAAAPEDEVFLPYLQTRRYLEKADSPFSYMTLVARTDGDAAALAPPIRAVVASMDRRVPVSQVQTMEDVVAQSTAAPRFYLLLLGAFAAVAVLLAAVGIYGVMSYSVSRRTNEIGIRMALGAQPAEVRRLVVGQGMVLALAGAALGMVGALGLTRLMSGLLYGVRASDPATFLAACGFLVAVALAASYFPARRASRINPLAALRHE